MIAPALRIACGIAIVGLLGCGAALPPRAVRLAPSTGRAREIADAALAAPLDPRVVVELAALEPTSVRAPDPSGSEAEARLSRARTAYTETLDFDGCRAELAEPALVVSALEANRRALAARLLFWRAACELAAGDAVAAAETADRMASLRLDVPEGADLASPRVEASIQAAVSARDAEPRGTLVVTTDPEGAAIAVDGQSAECTAPCELVLLAGEHVVHASLEGYVSTTERVLVEAGGRSPSHGTLPRASPDVALAQWNERYARADDVDGWPSVALLSLALRARELVLFSAVPSGDGLLLRATLAVDDLPPLRAERRVADDDAEPGTRALLLDLFRDAGITPPTPIYEEPVFWIAIVGAAALAAGIAFGATYQPGIDTTLVLRRPE